MVNSRHRALEKLLVLLDDLMDNLEEAEPDKDTEAHEEWEKSMDKVTDPMDEAQRRIEGFIGRIIQER